MLPALLLAVFIGAQIELVGHLHADDSPVADCLQCQFDDGQTVLPSNKLSALYASANRMSPQRISAAAMANAYILKARGPPALS